MLAQLFFTARRFEEAITESRAGIELDPSHHLPVSTTHVSCGALFGIGTVTHGAHWGTIRQIVLAWGVTLPLAAPSPPSASACSARWRSRATEQLLSSDQLVAQRSPYSAPRSLRPVA